MFANGPMIASAGGSGGGKPPRKPHRHVPASKPYFGFSDRFCVECGILIKGQATEKPRVCFRCQAAIPMRGEAFEFFGDWGRCPDCDSFIHRDMSHCQSCSKVNPVAIARKRQLEKAARMKEKFEIEQERKKSAERIKQLEEAQRKLSRQLMEKERQLEDANLLYASQQAEVSHLYQGAGQSTPESPNPNEDCVNGEKDSADKDDETAE